MPGMEIAIASSPKRRTEKLGLIDRIAAAVSPAWALKRQVARNRLTRLGQFKRGFEAVGGDRLRYDFLSTSQDADSFIAQGGHEALRQHVRYMEYQTGFVSGPIQRIVNNVVGTGFQFQARVRSTDNLAISDKSSERLNKQIERNWGIWTKQSDIRLIHQFHEILRLIEGALIRDGAVIVVSRKSSRSGRLVPFCQQVYEADRLKTPPGEITNPRLRNGVLYDAEGVPQTYFLLKNHPGNSIGIGLRSDDYEEVPAFNPNGTRKVFYLFNPMRPEQLMGFSQFAAALKDFQDLDRYREAEIMAALEDACLTGFVKSDASLAFQEGYTVDSDADGNRVHEFAPNKWHYLRPGESVDIHAPKRPNSAFKDLTEQLLMGPANALDIPPEVLTQNWQGMNYSNARTVLLQFYLTCRVRQQYLVSHYCEPTYEAFLSELVAMGLVRVQDFYSRKDDYAAHAWITPGWQWVDPLKEANAVISELEAGTENLPRVWARKGEDWEEQLEIQARVLKKKAELEKQYGITFPAADKPVNADSSDNADTGDEPARHLEVVK